MICWNKIEDFHIEEPTALSLGKFDGVHRGHEALIEHLLEKKKEGLKAVVFTFDIPPKNLRRIIITVFFRPIKKSRKFSKSVELITCWNVRLPKKSCAWSRRLLLHGL